MLSRTLLLASLCWLICSPNSCVAEQPNEVKSAVDRGYEYLRASFDDSVDLLPEYRGSRTYWLYHDNYLAAKVLRSHHPGLADRIEKTIAKFGVRKSGKIEILYGAKDGFPFRSYSLDTVESIDNKSIKTERVVGDAFQGWREYADLLFLAAVAQSKSNPDKAKLDLKAGFQLWDKSGFRDAVVPTRNRYATYKLALAIIAHGQVTKNLAEGDTVELPFQDQIVQRLLSLQNPDGGWITDYEKDGTPRGKANVETSCLVILAMETLGKNVD